MGGDHKKQTQILAGFIMACKLSRGSVAHFSLYSRWTIPTVLRALRVVGCVAVMPER